VRDGSSVVFVVDDDASARSGDLPARFGSAGQLPGIPPRRGWLTPRC